MCRVGREGKGIWKVGEWGKKKHHCYQCVLVELTSVLNSSELASTMHTYHTYHTYHALHAVRKEFYSILMSWRLSC